MENNYLISTLSVHAGEKNINYTHLPITTPIYQTSNFYYHKAQDYLEASQQGLYRYTRYENPTERTAIDKLCALENAEDGILVSSGVSAIFNIYFSVLEQGSHVIISNYCYHRSIKMLESYFKEKMNVEFDIIEPESNVEEYIKPNTRLIFLETPSNYLGRLWDISKVSKVSHKRNIVLCVDNTIATPVFQNPITLGADLVVHSASKYIGGHNDLIAGAILGKTEYIQKIKDLKGFTGTAIDPFCSYLIIRGLKTLKLRMEKINTNALELCDFLQSHPKIKKVYYPSLDDSADYDLFKKTLKGAGGNFYFELTGGKENVAKLIENLSIPYIASSFGGVESLVRFGMSKEYGGTDNLVRFSTGIEDIDDLINDFERALAII